MAAAPVSKRKSCGECVKAKRKCGMELPRCTRCAKKDIACSYPSNRNTIADMTFPELDFPWLDDLMRDPNMLPWSGSLQPQLDAVSQSTPSFSGSSESDMPFTLPGASHFEIISEKPIHSTLARAETEAALHRFKTWPQKWLNEGKAPFLHPKLYAAGMPVPLQDAYAACAIYSTKTEQNSFVAFTVIESKANELLRSPNQGSWTSKDLLAAVQALLIFQFIRLFDGDIRQRAQAEKAEPVLEAWTGQLVERTIEERSYTAETAPSWSSWVFGESARRTIAMSFIVAGVYSLVKLGYCTLGAQVSANSFTAQRHLWEAQSALAWERIKQSYDTYWIPGMNFDHFLEIGRGDELDDFGMMLLIMYKGQDVIDHWLETSELKT